jgi:energy-coupling factor transport system substrate-specific component
MKGYQYTPAERKSIHVLGTILVFVAGVIGTWVTILVGLGVGQSIFFGPNVKIVGSSS